MALDIEKKIQLLLSMENVLIPASTIDRNQIFFQLYKHYKKFFKDLKFKFVFERYFQSDVLDRIIFKLHWSQFLITVHEQNKYYMLDNFIKKQINFHLKSEIEKNQSLLEKIKGKYLQLFHNVYPNSTNNL